MLRLSSLRLRLPALLPLCAAAILSVPGTGCPAAEPNNPPDNPPAHNKHDAKHGNALADETSPYLLMHAHNPVDWHPWGEGALAKAKKENKPIFLSIGYSSCYWCHVMERESFMDKEIAALLNEHFICIKVDREERPDLDAIYMTAVQVISGRGGWPMSMFLTPDAQPFFGGTYWPARDGDRKSMTGFLTIVTNVHNSWTKEPDKIKNSAAALSALVRKRMGTRKTDQPVKLDEDLLTRTLQRLSYQYDSRFGGFVFGPMSPYRPKFPEPSNLVFLIDRIDRGDAEADGTKRAREMLVGTLTHMANGGIRDHLGGGFHRYSTDAFWRIPHFEKMLYDNGQLASVYADAYRITKREDFRRVTVELLDFVLREMTGEGGGFYSALDAESEKVEGKFYRWEKAEVEKLLSAEPFKRFAAVYGLDGEPNFEEHYYVPLLTRPLHEIAAAEKTTEDALEAELGPARKKLLAARAKRIRPLTDTKILTSWNGLMIRGFADAGRIFGEKRYVDGAVRAADFVLAKLRRSDGRLLRTYGQGQAKLNAYLDDYAFLVDGLIALHRATGDEKWLTAADELTAVQIKLFWDDKDGGFFFTSGDHESLIARAKNPLDAVQPSGNSVAAGNLVYLAGALDKPEYLTRAERTIQSSAAVLSRSPAAAPRMAASVAALLAAERKPQPKRPLTGG